MSTPRGGGTVESYIRGCPMCGNSDRTVELELAPTPLGFSLTKNPEDARALTMFPLDLARCCQCQHCYLPLVVEPDLSYGDYHFLTAESPGLSQEMDRMVTRLWHEFGKPGELVVDIGSNDGTWLRRFAELGARVLGVEPSEKHAVMAVASGVMTIPTYFDEAAVEDVLLEFGRPRLITANFVLANIPDLKSLFLSLRTLSGPDTTIAITTGYHPDQFQVNMFDFVYHEHLSYFSVRDFMNVAERFGFCIVEVSRSWLKGGSIQVLMQPAEHANHSESARRLVTLEEWRGVNTPEWFEEVRMRIDRQKRVFHRLIEETKPASLLGYGMSHSTTTLTYEFELEDLLAGIVDDAPSRNGWFAPGVGIPIESWNSGMSDRFDSIVILAWQHDKGILERIRARKWSKTVLRPLPRAGLVQGVS